MPCTGGRSDVRTCYLKDSLQRDPDMTSFAYSYAPPYLHKDWPQVRLTDIPICFSLLQSERPYAQCQALHHALFASSQLGLLTKTPCSIQGCEFEAIGAETPDRQHDIAVAAKSWQAASSPAASSVLRRASSELKLVPAASHWCVQPALPVPVLKHLQMHKI